MPSPLPPDAIPNGATRAALAVLQGARSVRDVGRTCGWQSTSTADFHLHTAKAAGLVAWEHRKNGTLRPAIRIIANG